MNSLRSGENWRQPLILRTPQALARNNEGDVWESNKARNDVALTMRDSTYRNMN
ncbi:MAG: hypothetical protein ACE5R6_13295 [Candidatus Heimdallarchaeota archaeon]